MNHSTSNQFIWSSLINGDGKKENNDGKEDHDKTDHGKANDNEKEDGTEELRKKEKGPRQRAYCFLPAE